MSNGERGASVAVVVLSKDEPELIHTLEILKRQCDEVGGECIVVDASQHRLDYIRDAHPWVKWISYTAPLGVRTTIPHQRNVGVRATSAPIVAYCDAGGAPSDSWLATLIKPIQDGQYDVTCGPVTSVRPGVYRTINDLPDGTVVDSVLTANLAFSRDAFDTVGGFDERFEYGSDADFAWRLIAAGRPPISIQRAVMGMDWGPWGLQRKRTWRYGKARGRLLRFHPTRRIAILRRNPELLVYPILALALPVFIWAAVIGWWQLLAVWCVLLGILRMRNRGSERPWAVVLSHFIYAAAVIRELVGAAWRKPHPIVVHAPKDPGPYQDLLIEALDGEGVRSGYLVGPTRSATLNLAFAPFRALTLRLRGVRVYHIHWAHLYNLHWVGDSRLIRRLLRWWFTIHLTALHVGRVRIVWTAHNVLPHEPIFDDDVRARKALVRRATHVIAHHEATASEVRERFGAREISVIPQGATPVHSAGRDDSRVALNLEPSEFVVAGVGRVIAYKGFEDLLEAAAELDGTTTIYIAGACDDDELRQSLEARAETARGAGVNVRLDLRRLDDAELAAVIAASDVVVYPFRSITNSGSVLLALASGRCAVVRDLPSLSDLPGDAVIRYGENLAHTLEAARLSGREALDVRGTRGAEWVATRGWDVAARRTREVYETVLKGRS